MKIRFSDEVQYSISFFLMIVSNVCFYTEDSLRMMIITSGAGMLLSIITYLRTNNCKITLDKCVIWLLINTMLYTLYGILWLRAGDYNWDMCLFTCVENITIYWCLKGLLKNDSSQKLFARTIIRISAFIIIYVLIVEQDNILAADIRVGDSLSGNVNTLGASLGILVILLAYCYIKTKKQIIIVLYVLTSVISLLTGSKTVIILIALSFYVFLAFGRNKMNKWLIVGIAMCLLIYFVFNNETLYYLIGSRMQDMFFQIFGIGRGKYSHSTADRMGMITDGIDIFLTSPIFGGGEKYFAYKSVRYGQYGYSHCNYIELLCNFGVIGFGLFYIPLIYLFSRLRRAVKLHQEKGVAKLGMVMLLTHFLLAITQVTYGEIAIFFLPIIIGFAAGEFSLKKIC